MKKEKTFGMVKPESFEHFQDIIHYIVNHGLEVKISKEFTMDRSFTKTFYGEHKEKPFFEGLVDQMTAGPVFAMCIEGIDAIKTYRKMMGCTDPEKAEKGTIRQLFGSKLPFNAVHGSDSLESANRELNMFFGIRNKV